VGLSRPTRDEFVERWDLYNDPQLGMLAMFQTAGATTIAKPPLAREHREAFWEAIGDSLAVVDIRTADDGRFVGEAGLSRMTRPAASADIGVLIFDPGDRARGYGTEAVLLLIAYAFETLALHRVTLHYISVNEAVVQAVERSAETVGGRIVGVEREAEWAFGRWCDRLVFEVVRDDFPAATDR
jgi:RimJ/RimL family protein N-acetyltransferase